MIMPRRIIDRIRCSPSGGQALGVAQRGRRIDGQLPCEQRRVSTGPSSA